MSAATSKKKRPGKPGPVVTRRKVRDGVLVSEEVHIDLTAGTPAEQIAAAMEAMPSVAGQVEAYARKAQDVVDAGAKGSRLQYAQDALWQARELHRYLQKGNAAGAVQHALWMMQCLWRMDVKGIEPTILTGARSRQARDRGRQEQARKARAKVERIQARAEKIWEIEPGLTITAVAKKIDPQNWDSVRKLFRKPARFS